MKTVTDPLRNTTTYLLDNTGNITQITDARERRDQVHVRRGGQPADSDRRQELIQPTTNTYDVRNRLTKACDALNRCATFSGPGGASGYDADDNLIQDANAAGITTQFSVRLPEPPQRNRLRRGRQRLQAMSSLPTISATA